MNKCTKYLQKLQQTNINSERFAHYLYKLNFWYSQLGGADKDYNKNKLVIYSDFDQTLVSVHTGGKPISKKGDADYTAKLKNDKQRIKDFINSHVLGNPYVVLYIVTRGLVSEVANFLNEALFDKQVTYENKSYKIQVADNVRVYGAASEIEIDNGPRIDFFLSQLEKSKAPTNNLETIYKKYKETVVTNNKAGYLWSIIKSCMILISIVNNGYNKDTCFFYDDTEQNIITAKETGIINAILVNDSNTTSNENLTKKLIAQICSHNKLHKSCHINGTK